MGSDEDGWTFRAGDLQQAHVTQVWLATSQDQLALSTGEYFYHQQLRAPNGIARDADIQERLLAECARISHVPFPD